MLSPVQREEEEDEHEGERKKEIKGKERGHGIYRAQERTLRPGLIKGQF